MSRSAAGKTAAANRREPNAGIRDLPVAVLADISLRESDLDRAADLTTQNPYPNPTPITRQGIRALLDDDFHGRSPTSLI